MENEYKKYLLEKQQYSNDSGFEANFIPDYLFDFQKHLVEWSIKKGRCALFEDCGLGKTIQQLVWAENIVRKTNKPVLILTPLAVSFQTQNEAKKFGIDCKRSVDGEIKSKIIITNYEKLYKFNHNDFNGVVCDESSILKSFDGSYKNEITKFMLKIPYRLLCTATAAPNDYIELGTSSEALGDLGFMDMLNKFFKNDNNNSGLRRVFGEAPKWRFKGHSEIPFWRWVTSWARACRKPSDIGFDDKQFDLKPLKDTVHIVNTNNCKDGYFLNLPATNLPEQREEKKRTIKDRCEKVLEIVSKNKSQTIIWCQLNDEGDYLEKIIPDAIQVSGKTNDEKKEKIFIDFSVGKIKNLITKPKIGAWGMNWQNCHNIVYFPSHSYEQYYQAIRRCWRFGQKNIVKVDIVLTEGEMKIMDNLKRKNLAAIKMFENLVNEMNKSEKIKIKNNFIKKETIPLWL
jgi:SNF2 family DNA or RNA helicase